MSSTITSVNNLPYSQVFIGEANGDHLLKAFPSEILARIFIYSGSTHPGVNRQFRAVSKIAMNHFLNEVLAKNPIFARTIHALRRAIGAEEWDALPNMQKLKHLHSAMVKKVQSVDPKSLLNLNISDDLDISIYREFIHLADLSSIQPKIVKALSGLPNNLAYSKLENLPLRDFQKLLTTDNIIGLTLKSDLKYLILENSDLHYLPQEIYQFKNLEQLSLENNNLTSVPSLVEFDRMSDVILSHNQIATLQNAKFSSNCKSIELKNNQITELQSFEFPTELEMLHLNWNRITTIRDVAFPKQMTVLDISHNQISTLSDVQFPDLKLLNISYNAIDRLQDVTLPDSLEMLVLDKNQVSPFLFLNIKFPDWIPPNFFDLNSPNENGSSPDRAIALFFRYENKIYPLREFALVKGIKLPTGLICICVSINYSFKFKQIVQLMETQGVDLPAEARGYGLVLVVNCD